MKLYKAKINTEILFTRNNNEDFDNRETLEWFQAELESGGEIKFSYTEITKEEDIPKDWRNCIPWGNNDFHLAGTTCLNFIRQNDKNYQNQLKLDKIRELEEEIEKLKEELL